jgi:hypothetical protein
VGIRYPFGWEDDPTPRRVPDRDPTEGRLRSSPEELDGVLPGAAELAFLALRDPDPNRKRRGAEGAADALLRESESRGWGLTPGYCRGRINRARSRAENK